MQRLSVLIAGLWAGSLWTVCALVAPSLFRLLGDRAQAGRIAGHFFRLETWIGIAAAAVLIAIVLAGRKSKLDLALIALTAVGPLLSELIVRPMMEAARASGGASFAALHGVSAAMFLVSCVSALALVWRLSRQAG